MRCGVAVHMLRVKLLIDLRFFFVEIFDRIIFGNAQLYLNFKISNARELNDDYLSIMCDKWGRE